MFGYENEKSIVVSFDWDPAADDVLPLWRAPWDCEIKRAYAINTNAVAADGTNYFALNLLNGGTAGTATTAISGTIGGTAGWTALLPVDFTVSEGTVSAGEVIVLNYNENGTGTFASTIIQLDVTRGKAADS